MRWIPVQRAHQDGIEGARNVWLDGGWSTKRSLPDLLQDCARIVSGERNLSDEAMIEHSSEGKNIRAVIDILSLERFGRLIRHHKGTGRERWSARRSTQLAKIANFDRAIERD
jgi:hypothetical protein